MPEIYSDSSRAGVLETIFWRQYSKTLLYLQLFNWRGVKRNSELKSEFRFICDITNIFIDICWCDVTEIGYIWSIS